MFLRTNHTRKWLHLLSHVVTDQLRIQIMPDALDAMTALRRLAGFGNGGELSIPS